MFLKTLTIHNENVLIRKIGFRKGINLIVDETITSNRTQSGNSVGKTTVLRLIDFCLDGNGENIYLDPEFGTKNLVVEKFLKENNILITLTLVENIDDEKSPELVIQRNFLSYGEKVQTINGQKCTNPEFSQRLKELIFESDSKDPSFRQLKSKNIRDEKNKLINTIKVLTPNVITDATYEALHLFWFGIDVDLSKDSLVRKKSAEEKFQARLRKESNLSQINQSLIIINNEISILNRKKEQFNVNEEFEDILDQLNNVKLEINEVSTTISRLELRKQLIDESRLDLEKNIADIDTSQIQRMYERAKTFIPDIQRTFEETLDFHNQMIREKVQFISVELPELERTILERKKNLSSLLKREIALSETLNKSGAIEDLQVIIDELTSYSERKGNFEDQKRLWSESIKNLEKINDKLDKINQNLFSKDDLIQERITKFNEYFSEISRRLDGVHSLLSADNSEGVYKFKIGNVEGNPGTGTKKSQMASFDLAYIKFADSLDIPCLHFVLQDQIENVHSNQITSLLTEIVAEINCQYVLPVLRDKLPTDINVSIFEVLSLSQNDKLFRI